MLVERNKVRPRNTFVRRAWQKKNSESISKSRTATKYLKLYCQYSSLNTLKYLVDSQRPLFERLLWVTIHCIIVSFLVFMVYISYREFVTIPLITSMETDSYRTTNLDFPGIAICSVNRISRQSASGLAIDIFNSNVTRQSLDEILDAIEQLGDLYPSDFDTIASRNVEIDQLLTTYYKGPYNITDIMKDLTPKCTVILLKCKLHGSYRNCSNLFEFRKTQDGFCCTFNYARESDDILDMAYAIQPDVHQVMDLGIERGLTVVMDPLLDDYFYSILPTVGWKVLVFNPTDFPDMTSGGVTEVLAMPLTETFLDVSATAFVSTKSVESFPREKRNCIFSDENSPMHGSTMYTYSDCIVDCKIYYIQKFCGCRPFFYPRRGPKEYSWRICNNLDMECLVRHKSKWMIIFPHEETGTIFQEKNALHCKNCYPACDDVSYDVLSWKSFMSVGGYNTNLLWNYNVTNEGILHVYFSKYGTIKLKQDLSVYWYELMSDIGGICGVFIGFSFISVVEVLYFFALTFRDLLRKTSALHEDNDREDEISSIQIQNPRTIHWRELHPRTWHSAKFSSNRPRY